MTLSFAVLPGIDSLLVTFSKFVWERLAVDVVNSSTENIEKRVPKMRMSPDETIEVAAATKKASSEGVTNKPLYKQHTNQLSRFFEGTVDCVESSLAKNECNCRAFLYLSLVTKLEVAPDAENDVHHPHGTH